MFGPALQEDQKRRQATVCDEIKDLSAAPEPMIGGGKSNPKTTTASEKSYVQNLALIEPSTKQWAWIPTWMKSDPEMDENDSLSSRESEASPSNTDYKSVKDADTVQKPSS